MIKNFRDIPYDNNNKNDKTSLSSLNQHNIQDEKGPNSTQDNSSHPSSTDPQEVIEPVSEYSLERTIKVLSKAEVQKRKEGIITHPRNQADNDEKQLVSEVNMPQPHTSPDHITTLRGDFISKEQAATAKNVSVRTVERWIKRGLLVTKLHGRKRLILSQSLSDFDPNFISDLTPNTSTSNIPTSTPKKDSKLSSLSPNLTQAGDSHSTDSSQKQQSQSPSDTEISPTINNTYTDTPPKSVRQAPSAKQQNIKDPISPDDNRGVSPVTNLRGTSRTFQYSKLLHLKSIILLFFGSILFASLFFIVWFLFSHSHTRPAYKFYIPKTKIHYNLSKK